MKEEPQPRDFVIISSVLHHPTSAISELGALGFPSSMDFNHYRAASVQPPEGAPRPPLVDHNADRLVEDHAGHETGFDPVPKRGFKAPIRMLVEHPEQGADHVPQQLAFGDAPHKSCPFTWFERTGWKVALTSENQK
jgi:hypothetical protein